MGRNYSNKNLTELEIGNIEFYLNEGKCPADIGNLLGKDPSGIRKEIKNYSSFFGSQRKCSNCLMNYIINVIKLKLNIMLKQQ